MSCEFECLSCCQVDMFCNGNWWWESEPACYKQTHGLPHQQQEKTSSFQSKWSLLKEAFLAGKSVFQACTAPTSCQRFLGNATLLNLFYFLFLFFIHLHIVKWSDVKLLNLVMHIYWVYRKILTLKICSSVGKRSSHWEKSSNNKQYSEGSYVAARCD